MKLYHGTSKISAKVIQGPPPAVDVSLGRGELGMGFYLGDSPFLAAALAVGRYGQMNSSVIEFAFELPQMMGLNVMVLKSRDEIFYRWKATGKKNANNFLFNVDVVHAAFATIDMHTQYKFESIRAEALLNCTQQTCVL